MEQPPIEIDTLTLLQELRPILKGAIDSMGGKVLRDGIGYLAWGAVHVHRATAGYCELRAIHHIAASKLLIRPTMETVFALVASVHKPAFLLEKAHAEHHEDLKLVNEHEALCRKLPASTVSDAKRRRLVAACARDRKAIEKAFGTFERKFSKLRPGIVLKRKKLSVKDAAEDAQLGLWYGNYRRYCQFTHGALRAITGGMDAMTDQTDNLVMIWLVLITLDHLKKLAPVEAPDLKPFWDRANAFLP